MFRRMIPLAVAIVIVMGCKKKKDEGGGDDGKVDSDPSATFTLKIREEQKGDKTEETESETGTAEISFGAKSQPEKQDQKLEFTEEILEMPAGAAKPTKLTRAYKVAQKYDNKAGAMKALPYEGKTVTIEKKGASYNFTVDGKKLNPAELGELGREFSKPPVKDEVFLPKKAVKVGEEWALDMEALKALGGDMPFPVDMSKSKITGKLTRAYTKDGKQWGVISLTFDLVVDSAAAPGKAKGKGTTTGTIKGSATMDTVIDGSSREGTQTITIKMDITGNEGGGELKIVADMNGTKTVKPLK